MVTVTATIQNAYGIHCRPSGEIAKAVRGYNGTISLINSDGNSANPTSVLAILSLGLTCGDEVTVQVEGENEESKAKEIAELLEKHYDFQR